MVEGDVGEGECGGGAVDRQNVGIVLLIGTQYEGDDLGFVEVALGEERSKGPVGETAGDDLFLTRTPFPLEEAARNASAGSAVFAVVDSQRQEASGLTAASHAGRGQGHGVAVAHDDAAVGLLGESAGLDGHVAAADFDVFGVFHFVSFSFFLDCLLGLSAPIGGAGRHLRGGEVRDSNSRWAKSDKRADSNPAVSVEGAGGPYESRVERSGLDEPRPSRRANRAAGVEDLSVFHGGVFCLDLGPWRLASSGSSRAGFVTPEGWRKDRTGTADSSSGGSRPTAHSRADYFLRPRLSMVDLYRSKLCERR